MLPAPAPSTSRGDIVLQPNYFTSSVYVKALRDDISTLILRYHEAYSQSSMKPFALFKTVWMQMGWHWLHFKVFDHRSRHTFLEVTARLFLERTVRTEAPFTRAVALFSLYIFFYTQIKDPIPALLSISNIPIRHDHYLSLTTMPECLATPHLAPLQPHARYLLSCLFKDRVFFILPKSDVGAMNPRELPRELHAEDGIVFWDAAAQKRKGRPARREKGKKARMALEDLDEWASKPGPSSRLEEDGSLAEYRQVKTSMMEALRHDPTFSSGDLTQMVLARLEAARESGSSGNGETGIERVREALADREGIFNLLR